MCGIFGIFTSSIKSTIPAGLLCRLAASQVKRGHHAWGCAWIDRAGVIRHHKRIGPVTDSLDVLADIANDAVALIGHTRWATHGSAHDVACAHPFTCDGGYLVHNGIVNNHEELAESWGVLPSSECDSEVLARCVECYADRVKGATLTINDVDRSSPLAIAALWAKPIPEIIVARRGNPMHIGSLADKGKRVTCFASTVDGMVGVKGLVHNPMGDNRIVHRRLFAVGAPSTHELAAPVALRRNVLGSSLFND